MLIPLKNQFLYHDIIIILDNEKEFITMQELTKKIDHSSPHAIKDACHRLQEKISELYVPDQLELIISVRNGVKLKRQNTNLRKLMASFNEESTAFHLLLEILSKCHLSAQAYCQENYISRSTLFRYKQKANELIDHFGVSDAKVIISDDIKITGSESLLRIFHYFILTSTYDSCETFTDWEKMIQQTETIFEYLALNFDQTKVHHIAIWTYVCQKAIDQDHLLPKDDPILPDLTHYEFQAKPAFLTDWQEADWQFYLLFLYALVYMPVGQAVTLKDTSFCQKMCTAWFDTFEKNYFSLSIEQKENYTDVLQRQLQCCRMTQFIDHPSIWVEIPREENIKEIFPIYYQKYQQFWAEFATNSNFDPALIGFKSFSFYDCVSLTKLSYFIATVSICVVTETTQFHNKFIEEMIRTYCGIMKIDFVADYQKADLIVSSTAFVDELRQDQQLLNIRTSPSKQDFERIFQVIQTISKQKTAGETLP